MKFIAMLLMTLLIYQLLLFNALKTYFWLRAKKWHLPSALIVFALANSLFFTRWLSNWGIIPLINVMVLLWLWAMSTPLALIMTKFTPKSYHRYTKSLLPLTFFILLAFAWHNAHSPVIVRYQIALNKSHTPFTLALVSDTHFSPLVGKKMATELVLRLNQEQPDLVLMPGDIINDNAQAFDKNEIANILKRIQAPVIATLGNHEFYGDADDNARAIEAAGFTLLRDKRIHFEDKEIIGRDDDHNHARASIEKLLENTDVSKPIIVLDHRPTSILEAAKAGVDIQVSGHTHRGQLFPANLITKRLYLLDYGHLQIDNTHFFTTSGYGYWGFPFRLGSRSEIMIIEVVSP